MAKCSICKQDILLTEVYMREYIDKSNNSTMKKGHKSCVDDWVNNHNEYKEFLDEMMKMFDVEKFTSQVYTSLGLLKKEYLTKEIKEVFEANKCMLSKHFKSKGWNYVYKVIKGLLEKEDDLKKELKNYNKNIENKDLEIATIKPYKKQETRNISRFL